MLGEFCQNRRKVLASCARVCCHTGKKTLEAKDMMHPWPDRSSKPSAACCCPDPSRRDSRGFRLSAFESEFFNPHSKRRHNFIHAS
jgi:hypothetical protein